MNERNKSRTVYCDHTPRSADELTQWLREMSDQARDLAERGLDQPLPIEERELFTNALQKAEEMFAWFDRLEDDWLGLGQSST